MLLWPVRQRCRKCRKYLVWEVVVELYCSRECAGLPAIDENPHYWPRQHYSMGPGRNPGRKRKRGYYSLERAQEVARLHVGHEAYQCGYCQEFHVGHSPKPVAPRTGEA